MEIKDIQKFCNDPDAWYVISMPDDAKQDQYVRLQGMISELDLPGKFIIIPHDVEIHEKVNELII